MNRNSLFSHRHSIIWTMILILLFLMLLAIAVAKLGSPHPLIDGVKGPNLVAPAQNDPSSQ